MQRRAAFRAVLLCGTALSAAAPLLAHAQPGPNASPVGGRVVAGSAGIAQNGAATVITQGSDRAAIDWRSFDVGRNASVTFQQPSAASATLNRVTGPDPSAIAGRISANGQVILTNPNGVTFYKGAQVNAQSVIVSAPGITNQNFMAGRMVFDQAAKPNARVENRGSITVKQAGLAALVAPSVANSGTITARMGTVVLAGAAAHTLDMYGDGLVSIDVTKQVRQLPAGPDGKPVTALVTNTGTIRADGGTIQLTARAADGVVQTLVDAGGTIRANTVGAKAGQIEIAGTGGAVVIAGRVAADGHAGAGGTIVLNGSTETRLTDTAHVSAEGRAGGGTIAVGTTLARARSSGPAPSATSARTTIAAGARLSASGRGTGSGGRVTVLSTDATTVAGTVSATGGAKGGDGGTIELSGETGFHLTGKADTSAPHGSLGTIVLDPRDLLITNTPTGNNIAPANGTDPNIGYASGGSGNDASVTPAQISALNGNIRLQTTRDLTVDASIDYATGSPGSGPNNLTLEAGRNLTITTNGSIFITPYTLTLTAGTLDPTGGLSLSGAIGATSVSLSSGTGGIQLASSIGTIFHGSNGAVMLQTTGAVQQQGGALFQTGALSITAGAGGISLAGMTSATDLSTNTPGPIATSGSISAQSIELRSSAGNLGLSGSLTAQNILLEADAGGIAIGATVNAQTTLHISTSGALTQSIGVVSTPQMYGSAGSVSLVGSPNQITGVGNGQNASFQTTSGNFFLNEAAGVPVTIGSPLGGGGLFVPTGQSVVVTADTVSLGAPANAAAITATGGRVTFMPTTSNRPILVSATGGDSNSLYLSPAELGSLRVGTLQLGQNSATGGPITLGRANEAIDLTSVGIGALALGSGGAISQGGPLTVASLSISGGVNSSVALTNANNQIGTLSSLSANDSVAISTAGNLSLGTVSVDDATISAGGSITQTTGTLSSSDGLVLNAGSFGGISLGGRATIANTFALTAGTGGVALSSSTRATTLSIDASGNITQAGPLTATSLSITSGTDGNVTLTNANNQIGTLASLAANNSAMVSTGGDLVLGTLNVGNAVISAAGSMTQPASGSLSGDGAVLNAGASGGISLGGGVSLNTLALTAGTAGVALPSGAFVTTLSIDTTGAITQAGPLTVLGSLSINGGTNSSVALTNANNQIGRLTSLIGNDNIAVTTVGDLVLGTVGVDDATISAGGSITQTGGQLSSSGGLRLNAGQSGGISLGGSAIIDGALTLTAGTGGVALPGSIRTTTLSVDTTGAVTQGQNPLSATFLSITGGINSSVALTNANNQIGTLTSLIGNDNIAVSTAGNLNLGSVGVDDATISAGGSIAQTSGQLSSSGGLRLNAGQSGGISLGGSAIIDGALTLTAGTGGVALPGSIRTTTLSVDTTGAVTQGQNALSATFLSGSAASVALTAANAISIVSQFSAGLGDFALTTTTPLTVGGAGGISVASTHAITLTTDSLTLAGSGTVLSAPNGVVSLQPYSAATPILLTSSTKPAGTLALTTAELTQIDTSNLLLGNASNTGGITLGKAGETIDLSRFGNLGLSTSATVTQGGPLIAPVIGSNAGSLTLTNPGNQIGTTAGVSVAGDVSLRTAGALSVGSTRAGGALTLQSGGAMNLFGALSGQTVTLLTTTNTTPAASDPAITETSNGSITATTLTGRAGAAQLNLSNAVSSLGDFAVGGTIALNDGTTPLALTGAVSAPGGLTLAAGSITQTAGTIATGALGLNAAGPVALNAANTIGTLVSSSSAGGLSLVTTGALDVTGPVSDGTAVSLRGGGNLVLGGTVTTGTLSLSSGGTLTQASGTVSAATLATQSGGTTTLAQQNAIGTLLSARSVGGFSLVDTGALVTSGPLSDPVAIALQAANLAFGGAVSTGTLTLSVPGAITQPGGSLAVGTLTGTAGSVALTAQNGIGTLGSFTAQGAFALASNADLSVNGLIGGSSVALSSGGNLALSGSIDTPGQLILAAGGTITQGAGSITASSLTGSAASATLESTGNRIPTLAGFTTTGDLAFRTAGDLRVSAPVDPNTVTLEVGGTLTLGSTVTGGTVVLNAGGGVVETSGGQVVANILSGTAASMQLGGNNAVDSIGTIATTGGFALASGHPLVVAGSLTDANVGIALAAPSIAFAGSVNAPNLSVASPGAVTQSGGTVAVGTFGGSVGSLDLGHNGSATIATLASLSATSTATIADAGPIAISGPLTAPALSVGSIGALTLAGGSIRSDSATFTVQPGANGRASLVQLGTTTLSSYSGRPPVLLFNLPRGGGTLTLTDTEAPGSNVILSLGSGTATGMLRAGTLTILGNGGSANLTGAIGARSDAGAAQLATLYPDTDLRYLFNSCAIAAIACTADPVGTIIVPEAAIASIIAATSASSTLRPDILTLGILDLSVTRDRDDLTFLLPNISDRDY